MITFLDQKSKLFLIILLFSGILAAQTPLYSGTAVSDTGSSNNIGNANTSRNVAIDLNGNIYVVYGGGQGVRVAKSVDRGQSYLPSIQITTNSTTEPEIAVGNNGLVFIAWVENSNIYYSRSTDGGVNFSTARLVGSGTSSVHMTIEGNNVYMIDRSGSNTYYNNNNGAGGFTRVQPGISYAYSDILTDQNGIVYVPTDDPDLYLFKSTDLGASYTSINITPSQRVYFSSYALSDGPCGTFIFVGGGGTFSSSTFGVKIDVNTGVSSPITLGTNDTTSQGRTLFADNQGTLVDGYRSSSGNLLMRISPDQGLTFNTPVNVATGTSHNIARNPFTDDIVVVYDQNGQIFTSVYTDILKSIKIPTPVPSLSFCSATNFDLDYLISGSFAANTLIEAFISDASGSFANSTLIGSATSNANGSISCTLPVGAGISSNYLIQLRITDDCLQSNSIPIEIGGSSNITGDLNVCIGFSTTLTGGGVPNSISPWTSSNTNVATIDSNGFVTSIASGTTQIGFTDENDCTATATFTVNELPTISGNLIICLNGTSQLTGSGSSSSANAWTVGNPSIITVDNDGLMIALSTGMTTVSYTDINDCNVTETVQVNQDLSITGDLNLCVGDVTILTGSSTGSSMPWIISNPSIATIDNSGTLTAIAMGSTTVTYTDINGCSITENVQILEQPTISGSFTTCVGLNSNLTGSGTPNINNAWRSDNTAIATIDSNGVVLGVSTGVVNIIYTNSAGCETIQQIEITNGATITGNMDICVHEELQLTGSGIPSSSNAWLSSNTDVATITDTGLITSLTAGTSRITYTDINSCDASINIVVNNLPEINISEEYTLCIDSETDAVLTTVNIDTSLDDRNYDFIWSLDGTVLPSETSSALRANASGVYEVEVINRNTGCYDIFTTSVIESSPPVLTASLASALFSEESTVIAMATGLGDYEFRIDDSLWQQSGTFENVNPGLHVITARDLNGCSSVSVELFILKYPKFFTPNDDNYNDTWKIENLTVENDAKVYIFDRYGKLLKQIDPTGLGWDGTFNGAPLPSSDYWFTIELLNTFSNNKESFSAHFALKR